MVSYSMFSVLQNIRRELYKVYTIVFFKSVSRDRCDMRDICDGCDVCDMCDSCDMCDT